VFAECETLAVFGRLIQVRLPERERLTVEPEFGKTPAANPIGTVQLLATLDLSTGELMRGLAVHPRIGDRLYAAHPDIVAQLVTAEADKRAFGIGFTGTTTGNRVAVTPEKLLGRHCGVLGSTGGGKSWTLARILEEIKGFGGKALLFDASGEFHKLSCVDVHTSFASSSDPVRPFESRVGFTYRKMTEADLFTIFRPSEGAQGPKLREAIKSLKLLHALNGIVPEGINIHEHHGTLIKANSSKRAFYRAANEHKDIVNSPYCDFDIKKLSQQVEEECVNLGNGERWGPANGNDFGYCSSLVSRIQSTIWAAELRCMFADSAPRLDMALDSFLSDPSKNIFRLSLEFLSFQYNARELIANAIGRYLLDEARKGRFKRRPLVVILDEAHQFLNKSVGDERNQTKLDAFGLIAKEGRKYGLTCVLATQRPRDIPEDVLSQLGTLVVHRLVNDSDRSVVERACGDLDRSATSFLPTLNQGEALLVGADFPMPVPIKVFAPSSKPDSAGPSYQDCWSQQTSANDATGAADASQSGGAPSAVFESEAAVIEGMLS